MRNTARILLGMWLAAATLTAMAAPGHYAIGVEQVAGAVGKMGIEVSPRQVTLLTDPIAASPAPVLTVRSIKRWNNHQMLVRMECEIREECLPFFALMGESAEISAAAAASPAPVPHQAPGTGRKSFVVSSGAPATLLLEDARIHIRIPVICLENGAPGQTIRVRGKENRLIYAAQVLDGTLLKGRL